MLSTRAHLLKQILGVVVESLLVVDCTPTWVEQERTEIRKKLEDETNRRTKEQNNNQHVVEKISNLEKERAQLAERLKKEQESVEKLKKTVAELQVARSSIEAAQNDLSDR